MNDNGLHGEWRWMAGECGMTSVWRRGKESAARSVPTKVFARFLRRRGVRWMQF
jgi:hypothetical protein